MCFHFLFINVLQDTTAVTKPGNAVWDVSGVLPCSLEFPLVDVGVFWGVA